MEETLVDNLAAFGVLAIFVLAFLERIVLIIPSYILFVLIGSVLVQDQQDVVPAILLSALGSTCGALLWYWAGTRLGHTRSRRWLTQNRNWLLVRVQQYDACVQRLQKNDALLLFISQIIPTIRIVASLPAGVMGLSAARFIVPVFLGCCVWNGALIVAGAALQTAR